MWLYWVLGHDGVRGNEIADRLARDGSVQKFVGPKPSLGVSRRGIRRQITSNGQGGKVLVVLRDRIEN